MRGRVVGFFLGLAYIIVPNMAYGGVWDMDLPYRGDDPQWVKIKGLWDQHWDGKNLDAIVIELKKLEARNPDQVEPYLWLAKVYNLKGRWNRKDRQANLKLAEEYAVKAHSVDQGNLLALKLLVDTMPLSEENTYTLSKYGDWIKGAAPLPIAAALPPLNAPDVWGRFSPLWSQRVDIEKAVAAVKILEDYARTAPNDGLAHLWASRGNYYIGMYYTSIGQHDEKGVARYLRGSEYGEQAQNLLPHSVPAHYWYMLNLARAIQNTSLFHKARYFNKIVPHLMFCARENGQYYFFGPNLTLGTMIAKGGWITRQGMKAAGVTLETEFNALDLAEILYPEYFYIPYVKAEILASQGKKAQARKILERLLARNPDANKLLAPDNRCYLRMAKQLAEEIAGQT